MSSKIGKKGRNPGAVDNWLDALGLYRKNVAYDETCLFRAISEQLFDCQVYHERVRRECLTFAKENYNEFSDIFRTENELVEHIDKLEKHMVVCGDTELKIISKKYNRSIIIFDAAEQQIFNFTTKELPQVFLLCLMDKDHYDVVYKKEHINSAGFCQSIVYKILYQDVFKIPNVDEIVHSMLYDKCSIITQAELMMEKKRMLLEPGNEDLTEEKVDEKVEEKSVTSLNIAPFPFKIAKALDPNIYRNIEYDSWGEMRREWRLGEWYYGDNKLILGTKCIYTDEETNEKYDCYIQEIIKNDNKCVIYLTKLAEKRTVTYSDLSPEDDAKPWPLPYRFTKSVVISPSTPPPEKSAGKPRRRNKDKKRTKSESSILCATTAIKHEPLVDNIDAYVGIPLQMHNPNSSDISAYCQTETSTDTHTDPVLGQENIPTVLVENETMDGSHWSNNGYQWQPYMPQTVDPFVWPTSPSPNQNVFNYNLKPMVASAPVTPSIIPYHDPNYSNYYYNYHLEPYQTYPQWSSPSFELQAPPAPKTHQEKTSEQDENTVKSTETSPELVQSSSKSETNYENKNNSSTPERPTLRFPQASETPSYAQPCAPCTPIEMYSPMSPVMQLPHMPPGAPILYTAAPPEMTEVVMPTTPVMYTPSLEVPYMSSSPYNYPSTLTPTWYPAGITAQGFIFPQRP